jgi:hypothetical protein
MQKILKKSKITLIIIAIFCFYAFLIYTPSARAATCANDAACESGEFCSGGTESGGTSGICLEDFAEGEACDRPAQCPTPYCAEGICSATAPATGTTTPPSTTTPSKPPSQELINPLGGTAASPAGVTSVPALIANIIKTILGVVGAVALFMFVWGGFGWLTSGGNPDKVKQGRDTLVWATIGLLVIFASYTLVDVVFRALGAI